MVWTLRVDKNVCVRCPVGERDRKREVDLSGTLADEGNPDSWYKMQLLVQKDEKE
jgi:hypothetical protein